MTYDERAAQVAQDSTVAVLALLGTEPGDSEFIPLRPRFADQSTLAELAIRWPGRGLRPVGVIGLCGTSPRVAFREPLSSDEVAALSNAFLVYLNTLLSSSFQEQLKVAEIQKLQPDRRLAWSAI